MDTLQSMRIFVSVAETGSFSRAARSNNTNPTNVSRAVSALEDRLRARLLNRTTRKVTLTEAGERYLTHCERILKCVDEAEAEAQDATLSPIGTLRAHATTSFGRHYVVPAVERYYNSYPDVHVQLTLSQGIPDPVQEGFDVSLVVAPALADSRLISLRLASTFSIVCASPAYLKRRGTPYTPHDLARHNCFQAVSLDSHAFAWSLAGPNGVETIGLEPPPFEINLAGAVADAIRRGMGIGLLPLHTAIDGLHSGDLVWILKDYHSESTHVYALYPSKKFLDAKTRCWIELVREEIPSALERDLASLHHISGIQYPPPSVITHRLITKSYAETE
jgi:DNA-binding transcriptional LysR family regulator